MLPVWFGVLVLGVGALSAVGGVVYALFQHDLKRLLALHSIENVGIIVLGLGACLVLRARGAETWAAFALAAALLHTLNHAVFKALLFLGAGAFERAVGSLELDRLGGLLRRMPWTGGAFLVGAMAIAGLPPLNGFASEWPTLQALLHVPRTGGVGDGVAGRVALAALAATAALAVFCFVKVVGLVLLGPPRRDAVAAAEESPLRDARGVVVARARLRRPRSRARASSSARSSGSLRGRPRRRRSRSRPARAPGRCRPARSRSSSSARRRCCSLAARSAQRGAGADLGVRAAGRAGSSAGRAPGSRSRCGSCSRPCCAREREITVRTRRRRRPARSSYSGHVPHLIDEHVYRPVDALALALRPRRRGGCRAAGSAPTSRYLIGARASCCSPRREWG